jgi:hypothetical protein
MDKTITKYNKEYLKQIYMIGLKVSKNDIKPPQIILIQSNSKVVDSEGKKIEAGKFYHTGKFKVMDSFDCYFIYVKRDTFVDKRGDGQLKPRFVAIGVDEDFSLFGMIFKNTYLYTLSSLFTAVASNQKPMFVFKCKMETKELSGAKGDWFVPVLRIQGEETDESKLKILEELARRYDQMEVNIKDDEEEVKEEEILDEIKNSEVEVIEEKDIPF